MDMDDDIEITSRRDGEEVTSRISEPGKLLRIGVMLRALQQEVAAEDVDASSRERLRHIHQRAMSQLDEQLSGALRDELEAFTLPFGDDPPSEDELRIARAQLIGWLEGLLQGIQAAVASQQHDARQQLAQLRGSSEGEPPERGTGQYL
jgi:hypothetical protein